MVTNSDDIDVIVQNIRTIVCEQLELDPTGVIGATDLRELPGIESVKVLRIISLIEQHYNVELDDDLVFGSSTITDLSAAIWNLQHPSEEHAVEVRALD